MKPIECDFSFKLKEEYGLRIERLKMNNNPSLTIIATTFGHGILLDLFCLNMLAQTRSDWHCIVLHDGSEADQDPTVRSYSRESKRIMQKYLSDGRFTYIEAPERVNQFGHNLRDIGLSMTNTKYLHWTNADNQYCIRWVEYVVGALEREDAELVYYPCFHNYRAYDFFNASLGMNCIDFVNYVVRTDLAKELGFPWRDYAADGQFIEAIKRHRPGGKYIRIGSGLAFHN